MNNSKGDVVQISEIQGDLAKGEQYVVKRVVRAKLFLFFLFPSHKMKTGLPNIIFKELKFIVF